MKRTQPAWMEFVEPAHARVRRGAADEPQLRDGEVHFHWRGLIPALLAILAAFPFEVNPLWSAFVGMMVLVVFTVRLRAPRTGMVPSYVLMALMLVLAFASLLFSEQVGLAPRSMVGQFVAFAALVALLLPLHTYRTFTACVVCLMTLVANGLMRTDLEYSACLAGFLLTLPGLMLMGHAHETVRERGLAWRSPFKGWSLPRRVLAWVRYTAGTLVTVGAGVLLYFVLPKPAVMPLTDARFAGVSNTMQDSLEVGRGPIPRGGQPFLHVEAPTAPYLLGQVFDRYDAGKWARTPGLERTLLDRRGTFRLPPAVDGQDGGAPPQRAMIKLARELPDLMLLPEGTIELSCASWHVLGNPPLHLRSWSTTPLATYAVEYLPPVRLEGLRGRHAPAGLPEVKPRAEQEPAVPSKATTEVPRLDPRVVALAREWTAGEVGDAERVRALVRRLGERCRYDTSALTPRGADPVTHMMMEVRAGYCMHFATALALMCRAIGIPSRLATGYAPGAAEPGVPALKAGDTAWAVRPRDAHAWTHVWIEGHGWVTVDATEGILVVSYRDRAEDLLAGDALAPAKGVNLDNPVMRSMARALQDVSVAAYRHAAWMIGGGAAIGIAIALVAYWRTKDEEEEGDGEEEGGGGRSGRERRSEGEGGSGGVGDRVKGTGLGAGDGGREGGREKGRGRGTGRSGGAGGGVAEV